MEQPFNTVYKRMLPHIQPVGGIFFVTFRLFGSIPKEVITQWQLDKQKELERIALLDKSAKDKALINLKNEQFYRYESYLESDKTSLHYFKEDSLAKVVADALHYWDSKKNRTLCLLYHV